MILNKSSASSRQTQLCLTLLFLIGHTEIFLSSAMRIVVQRVKRAAVHVDGICVSSIGPRPDITPAPKEGGMLALVGLHENDTDDDLLYCAKRLVGCKLWNNADDTRPWRHSVKQKQFPILMVSQFTLYGTLTKKNQPDYKLAMKSEQARVSYEKFKEMVAGLYDDDKVHDGVFGAMMDVELVNDGPVTIVIESQPSSSEKSLSVKKELPDSIE